MLNFFFDTPIITRITLEMRITIFDQISAVGGTLGLFTGVSLITFAELVYWGVQFLFLGSRRTGSSQGSSQGSGRGFSPFNRTASTKVQGLQPNPTLVTNFKTNYMVDGGGNNYL